MNNPSPGLLRMIPYLICAAAVMAAVSLNLAQRQPVYAPISETRLDVEITHADWNTNSDRLIVVGTADGVRIYDQDFVFITQFNQGIYTRAVAWSADNAQIAVTNANTVEIWNWDNTLQTASLNRTLTIEAGYGPMMRLKWSPHGDRIAALAYFEFEDGDGSRLYIWDTTAWMRITMPGNYFIGIEYPTPDTINWDPDNPNQLWGVGSVGQIENGQIVDSTGQIAFAIDVRTGERTREISVGQPWGDGIAKRPGENMVAVGTTTSLQRYDALTGERFPLTMIVFATSALAWSPNGRYIIADSYLIDVESDMGMGLYEIDSTVVAADWREDGGAILLAQSSGRMTIEDPFILTGYERTITPTGEWTEEVYYPPVAVAGPDQTLEARQQDNWQVQVALDGSGSYDPDGEIVNYSWRRASNDVPFATGVNPQIPLSFGDHELKLVVEDDEGYTGADYLRVVIDMAPTPTRTPTPTSTATTTPSGTPVSRPTASGRSG